MLDAIGVFAVKLAPFGRIKLRNVGRAIIGARNLRFEVCARIAL